MRNKLFISNFQKTLNRKLDIILKIIIANYLEIGGKII